MSRRQKGYVRKQTRVICLQISLLRSVISPCTIVMRVETHSVANVLSSSSDKTTYVIA